MYSQENTSFFLVFKVIDSSEKDLLTFVSVTKNTSNAVIGRTDFDGQVILQDVAIGDELIFTHVGFEPKVFTVTENVGKVTIEMHRSAHLLREFEVRGQKDKSMMLMQKVVDNFDRNNPLKVSDFTCQMYNKMVLDFSARDSGYSDSVNLKIKKMTKGGHLMLLESVVQFSHHRSGISEEKVLASKVSGFEKPEFALLASDFQPFGFYEKRLHLLDMDYLNPVSQGGLNKYKYRITDTLFIGKDSVFIVKFTPNTFGYDRLLSGSLYIHSGDFALQNVVARAGQPGLVDFELEQVFSQIEGRGWFPKELNFELSFKDYPNEKIAASVVSRSTVNDVSFESLKRSELDVLTVKLEPEAFDRDSAYWDAKRGLPLTHRERVTYENMDSLSKKLHFGYLNRVSQSLAVSRLPIGFLDVDLSQTLKMNRYENIRLGTGIYSNSEVSKFFSLGGHFGYGLKDKSWKYGGSLRIFPRSEILNRVEIKYNNDIREAGDSDNAFELQEQFEFRDVLINRMERYEGWSIGFHSTKIRYADINIGVVSERIVPLFNYEFSRTNGSETTFYNHAIDIQFNYNFKSKLYKLGNNAIRETSKYPQFKLAYRKGFSWNGSGFNYDRLFAEVKSDAYLFGTLKSSITLNGGFINNSVPVSFLFGAFGSNASNFSIFMPDYFQTMPLNDYIADRYGAIFLKQELLNRTFETNFSSPKIALWQAMGYGTLRNATSHSGITFRTLQNGYLETGLMLDEILKYKYVNLVYCNLGGGVFYGYGYNAHMSTLGAPVFRLSFSATFR